MVSMVSASSADSLALVIGASVSGFEAAPALGAPLVRSGWCLPGSPAPLAPLEGAPPASAELVCERLLSPDVGSGVGRLVTTSLWKGWRRSRSLPFSASLVERWASFSG